MVFGWLNTQSAVSAFKAKGGSNKTGGADQSKKRGKFAKR